MRDKRRWIEWGKDALIVLLTLSAVSLLSMTPLVQDSGLLELLRPTQAPGGPSAGVAQTWAVLPARMVVCRDGERFGLQYDEGRMEEVFASFGPLLGDALAAAGEPQPLTEAGWRGSLLGSSVYFDFSGDVPLAALSGWLGGDGECALTGSARRVLLASQGDDQVALCWQDAQDGGFYTCPTALSHSLHLDAALAGVNANGAYFAFEDPELSRLLDPYTLIAEAAERGVEYAASSPLTASGREAMLDAFSFNDQNHAPGSSGEVYLDGSDRLVVGDSGTVTYRAARGGKYPAGTGAAPLTAAGAADAARLLMEQVVSPLCGDARLYLISALPYDGGWRVRFGYRLDGCAVYLYDEGWAAEFIVQDGSITQFTIHFRCYTAGGADTLLPPIDKAAVMLPDLTKDRRELTIQYRDRGGASVAPGWVGN